MTGYMVNEQVFVINKLLCRHANYKQLEVATLSTVLSPMLCRSTEPATWSVELPPISLLSQGVLQMTGLYLDSAPSAYRTHLLLHHSTVR